MGRALQEPVCLLPLRPALQVSQRTADGMWVALGCGVLLQSLVYCKAPDIIACG